MSDNTNSSTDLAEPLPESVGTARMQADGTLRLFLRTETPEGMVGEMVMVVPPGDPRHADMVRHLSGIQPGEARPIPPFPEPEIDPNSI
jgi:hypothetical protein